MIISDKYKYIFLHVPKVAGSSIAVYLSQFLGDDDLMLDAWNDTLIHRIPYNKRVFKEINTEYGLKMIGEALSLRMNDGKIFERPVLDYALRKTVAKSLKTESVHATGAHIKAMVPEKWDEYFKFAFVRNPYTHAISFWRWNESVWSLKAGGEESLTKEENNETFLEFLTDLKMRGGDALSPVKDDRSFLIPGSQIYTLNDELCVDFIGRFENLQDDIKKIHKRIGLPAPVLNFPHTKKNSPVDTRSMYCNEAKSLVEEIWAPVFKLFDYGFPRN